MKTTFSIIKADVGGWPKHATNHPDLQNICNGFNFKTRDIQKHKNVLLKKPENVYDLSTPIGAKSHFVIKTFDT